MSLVGKFVFHAGAHFMQFGIIEGEPFSGCYLMRFDNPFIENGTSIQTLVSIDDMVMDYDNEELLHVYFWRFFDTRAELDAYVTEFRSSSEPAPLATVVPFVKK